MPLDSAETLFRDWAEAIHEGNANIYWLTGPPAVGKSTLSSFIVNYLKQGFIPGTCEYHFFQAEHHDTRTIAYFIRSLAFQIAQEHEEFRSALVSAQKNSSLPFTTQKYQVLWDKLFEGILFRLRLNEPLIWVLDGLDEAESQTILCDLLTKITSATSIKILLVSRPTKALLSALSTSANVQHEKIQIEDTAKDIESYIEEGVCKIIPDNINEQRTKGFHSILSRANGSFLWVKLALERVEDNWYTADDIQTALDGIPEGMDTMYTRMLQDIGLQSARNRDMAIDILIWASCVFRPLMSKS